MAEGKAIIIAGVEEEIDPFVTPVLEKQITVKAKSKSITVGGKVCDYVDEFMLYLVTRLPNPHFSPEDQSKCTIVDFTVTLKGLEEQLLGRVIQKEQRSLEESLKSVLEEVTGQHQVACSSSTKCCWSASLRTRATCWTTRSSSACWRTLNPRPPTSRRSSWPPPRCARTSTRSVSSTARWPPAAPCCTSPSST